MIHKNQWSNSFKGKFYTHPLTHIGFGSVFISHSSHWHQVSHQGKFLFMKGEVVLCDLWSQMNHPVVLRVWSYMWYHLMNKFSSWSPEESWVPVKASNWSLVKCECVRWEQKLQCHSWSLVVVLIPEVHTCMKVELRLFLIYSVLM